MSESTTSRCCVSMSPTARMRQSTAGNHKPSAKRATHDTRLHSSRGYYARRASLSFGLGHLIELPARMAWDQYLWVGATVQGGLYALSGPLGVLVQVATVVAMIVLAMLLRRHRASGFPFTVAA